MQGVGKIKALPVQRKCIGDGFPPLNGDVRQVVQHSFCKLFLIGTRAERQALLDHLSMVCANVGEDAEGTGGYFYETMFASGESAKPVG
jgi:hypothetical protein